ncbi:hypothetical protein D3C79_1099570 [compost metagenome]
MYSGNRRLQAVHPELLTAQRLLHQLAALGDQCAVPQAAVLLIQHDQLALLITARRLSRGL